MGCLIYGIITFLIGVCVANFLGIDARSDEATFVVIICMLIPVIISVIVGLYQGKKEAEEKIERKKQEEIQLAKRAAEIEAEHKAKHEKYLLERERFLNEKAIAETRKAVEEAAKIDPIDKLLEEAKLKTEAMELVYESEVTDENQARAVDGNPDEYLLYQLKNGWMISRYIGFPPEKLIVPNVIDGKRIVAIGPRAFKGTRKLEHVVIPDGIHTICREAFENCAELHTLESGNGLTEIEDAAFYGCPQLTNVQLAPTLVQIGSTFTYSDDSVSPQNCGAFQGTAINSIIIPDCVHRIGNSTFRDCGKLSSIKLSSNIRELPYKLFSNCENLSRISLPRKLITIGRECFENCAKLKSVTVPKGTRHIRSAAFCGCRFTKITLPESLAEIGENFLYNKTLGNNKELVVFCEPGSVAMRFARNHAIKCQPIPHRSTKNKASQAQDPMSK